jgi:hypothetical protein
MTEANSSSNVRSNRSGQNDGGTVRRRGPFAVLLRPKVAIPLALFVGGVGEVLTFDVFWSRLGKG